MKAVNKPFVGQLVQIPAFEFAPMRSGWNGWIFRVGVIEKLYISKSGRKCAKVRYCTKTAGRYQLLPCTEYSKGFVIENVFQWDGLEMAQKSYAEFKSYEDNGEQVCWNQDTAFFAEQRIHSLNRNGLTYRANGEKGKNMERIYSLIKLFGERYIFCDAEQALVDCQNREELVAAFAAIMEYIRVKSNE